MKSGMDYWEKNVHPKRFSNFHTQKIATWKGEKFPRMVLKLQNFNREQISIDLM